MSNGGQHGLTTNPVVVHVDVGEWDVDVGEKWGITTNDSFEIHDWDDLVRNMFNVG